MRIAKYSTENAPFPSIGLVEGETLLPLDSGPDCLSSLLHAADPVATVSALRSRSLAVLALNDVKLLAPLDSQEVWGAGVTYERSKVARQEESEQGGSPYDLAHGSAPSARALLLQGDAHSCVVGPGAPIRVRRDTRWCVPEPELALVLSPDLKLVGFTIGNDVSARDIEGENPLYLPQAKVYDACCALGPVDRASPGPCPVARRRDDPPGRDSSR